MLLMFVIEIEQDVWKYDEDSDSDLWFWTNFGMNDRSIKDVLLVLIYYSFTSLTTVGFGDFHPRSNLERIVVALGLMLGVAIFSWIMGNFIDIVNQYI